MENATVVLTAGDDAAAQKALDALAAAGFYGSTDNQKLAVKAVSDVPQGQGQSLKVSGIHNCCGLCCEAIKEASVTVDGVTGDTAKPTATTFEVMGDLPLIPNRSTSEMWTEMAQASGYKYPYVHNPR
jgi:hypothetical protein